MITISKETGISAMMKQMNSEAGSMTNTCHLETPLTQDKVKSLRAGDVVYLSGTIYGARDAAHKRMLSELEQGKKLPLDVRDITIFYVGPSPAPPGKSSGSLGPTTAVRMDGLTEPLMELGLRAMIGKGKRSEALRQLCIKHKAVYLIAVGGIAAYLSSKVCAIETVAYGDLGPEAIHRIQIADFPLFVAYDIYGGDIYKRT
jgi:fumarate hydratase subunit beta